MTDTKHPTSREVPRDLVEAAARLICEIKGYDPDAPAGETRVQWETFTELAAQTVQRIASPALVESECIMACVNMLPHDCAKAYQAALTKPIESDAARELLADAFDASGVTGYSRHIRAGSTHWIWVQPAVAAIERALSLRPQGQGEEGRDFIGEGIAAGRYDHILASRPIPAEMPDVAGLCERLRKGTLHMDAQDGSDSWVADVDSTDALLAEAATALERMSGVGR